MFLFSKVFVHLFHTLQKITMFSDDVSLEKVPVIGGTMAPKGNEDPVDVGQTTKHGVGSRL